MLSRLAPLRTLLPLPLTISAFLALAGCGDRDPSGPEPAPSSLVLSPSELTIHIPHSTGLEASVLDQTGATMSGEPVTFLSRDPTTAAVDSQGTVIAVAGGDTWIVARSGVLEDSARISVRYELEGPGARVRVRLDEDVEETWEAEGVYFDHLGDWEPHLFLGAFGGGPSSELVVGLLFREPPDAGRFDLAPLDPGDYLFAEELSDLPGSTALALDSEDPKLLYAALEGSQVLVDSLNPAPGLSAEGTVWGRLVLRAAAYAVDGAGPDAAWTATGDTLDFYADFTLPYAHLGVGQARVEFLDGPRPEGLRTREAWWIVATELADGRRYGYIDVEDGPPELRVWMTGPSVGDHLVSHARPGSLGPVERPAVIGAWRSPPLWLYSSGGTMSIHELEQPTGDVAGRMGGTLTATLDYWDDWHGDKPVDAGILTMEFVVPIFREDGWESSLPGIEAGTDRIWHPLVGEIGVPAVGAPPEWSKQVR